MHVAVSRVWEAKSWDRFQIPKPFARAVCAVAKPIFVAPAAGDTEVAEAHTALQAALDGLRSKFG